jgi:hypothetical protein
MYAFNGYIVVIREGNAYKINLNKNLNNIINKYYIGLIKECFKIKKQNTLLILSKDEKLMIFNSKIMFYKSSLNFRNTKIY